MFCRLCYCNKVFYIQLEKNATIQRQIVSVQVSLALCIHAATGRECFSWK